MEVCRCGTAVQPVDPLFLDENARWYDETPIKRPASEDDPGWNCQARKGQKGLVRIRACWFPYNFHLQDPEGRIVTSNHNSRYRVMKANNGILVCRAGRQIDTVTQYPGSTFPVFDRYWKIEIDFDPLLDEYFGITTHKQQIVISESMIGHLKDEGFPGLITDLRRKMLTSRAVVKAAQEKNTKKPLAGARMPSAKTQPRKPKRQAFAEADEEGQG